MSVLSSLFKRLLKGRGDDIAEKVAQRLWIIWASWASRISNPTTLMKVSNPTLATWLRKDDGLSIHTCLD